MLSINPKVYLFLLLAISACTPKITQTGKASYYASKFNGRKTANGEIYRNGKLTAAHKTLPYGTIVKVTSLKSGKSVKVRVNDRGPFVAGRIIDLSQKAAGKIDLDKQGVGAVKISYKKPKKK